MAQRELATGVKAKGGVTKLLHSHQRASFSPMSTSLERLRSFTAFPKAFPSCG
jgi:hypothetical protein